MNILEKIAQSKREEVQLKKEHLTLDVLEILPHFSRHCLSLKDNLQKDSAGIIAEFKRRSPSLPDLNLEADVEEITSGYESAGASGISVLTDELYFGGTLDDLLLTREIAQVPLLRKDFIIDEFQIYEAKAFGADVILLIAALLTPQQIRDFARIAGTLGLEVLMEVHDEEELLRSLTPEIHMVGVNNRNLKTFQVDIETSKQLAEKIPQEFVRVSESGISAVSSIRELQQYGYKGFLIGENFMKTRVPGQTAAEFIKELLQ